MDGIKSALSFVRAGRGYADKVSIAHDDHGLHGLRGPVIAGNECCPERRWAQHFAVEHARKRDVCGVLVVSGHERPAINFWNRFPGDSPLCCGRDGILRWKILRKHLPAREFRILKRTA